MHPPLDKRVHHKEAVALVRAGYHVVHVAPGDPECREADGVEIITYSGRRSKLGRIFQLPKLWRLARKVDADYYHCNEVDSWMVGVLLKVFQGKVLTADIHEMHSNDLADSYFPAPVRSLAVKTMRVVLHVLTRFTDRLVLAKKSIAKEFPRVCVEQVVVENYVETAHMPDSRDAEHSVEDHESFTAIHVGAINRARGWPQMLDALTMTKNPAIKLKVVGRFGDGSEADFLQAVKDLGLQDRVKFQPWLPYSQVQAEIAQCQVGLIMFQPVSMNFIHAMPHKLFDYMLAEIPTIAPACAVEVVEIVHSADCGLTVDSTCPKKIAEALDHLADSPERCHQLGGNGRRAVLEKYNWENEAKKLVEMYQDLNAVAAA